MGIRLNRHSCTTHVCILACVFPNVTESWFREILAVMKFGTCSLIGCKQQTYTYVHYKLICECSTYSIAICTCIHKACTYMHCTDEAQIACNLKQLSAVALLVPIFFWSFIHVVEFRWSWQVWVWRPNLLFNLIQFPSKYSGSTVTVLFQFCMNSSYPGSLLK